MRDQNHFKSVISFPIARPLKILVNFNVNKVVAEINKKNQFCDIQVKRKLDEAVKPEMNQFIRQSFAWCLIFVDCRPHTAD